MTKDEALRMALGALEETRNALAWFYDSYPQDVTKKGNELLPHVETVLAALREAQPEPAVQGEPVRLRRGDVLRCIETDELCTVWSTSTTGNALIKWSDGNFGNYTAEQIGDLFWIEKDPEELELAAEKADNYASFHAGYKFAIAHTTPQPAVPDWQNTPEFKYATSLVEAIFRKHYANDEQYASGQVAFEIADSMVVMLTQIDNMTCRLVREDKVKPAVPGRKPLTDEEIKRRKPISADFVSFRAGVRCMEREYRIGEKR